MQVSTLIAQLDHSISKLTRLKDELTKLDPTSSVDVITSVDSDKDGCRFDLPSNSFYAGGNYHKGKVYVQIDINARL